MNQGAAGFVRRSFLPVAVVCVVVFTGIAIAQESPKREVRTSIEGLVLPIDSPFFKELLARPYPTGREDLFVLTDVFRLAGKKNASDALLQRHAQRELMPIIGETFQPPATVADGATYHGDSIQDLTRRALRAMFALEPASGQRVTENPLRVRIQVTNRYTRQIEEFEARMEFGESFPFRCRPVHGSAFPPGEATSAICEDAEAKPRLPATIQRLRMVSQPLAVASVRLPEITFGVGTFGASDENYRKRVEQKARAMLENNPCEALNACGLAEKQAKEQAENKAAYAAFQEQEQRRREARLREKEFRSTFGLSYLFGTLLVTLLAAAAGGKWRATTRGYTADLLAAWVFLAGAFIWLTTVYALTRSTEELGLFLLWLLAAWLYAGIALLPGVLVLGGMLFLPEHRNIVRMACLGFGFAAGSGTAAIVAFTLLNA
jgi:hypothetical protein